MTHPTTQKTTPDTAPPLHRAVCSDGHIIDGPWFEHAHGMLMIPCLRRVLFPKHLASTFFYGAVTLALVGVLLRLDTATTVYGVGLALVSLLAFVLSGFSKVYSGDPSFFVQVSPHLLQSLRIRPMGYRSHWISFGNERITAVMNPSDFARAQVLAREAGYPYRSVHRAPVEHHQHDNHQD